MEVKAKVGNLRLEFEGDLDKWMKIIGAGITGYQPEAYALMDLACAELVRKRRMFEFLNNNPNVEIVWKEMNGDLSECCWQAFRRNGGRNDQEWSIIGFGDTVEEAVTHAMGGACANMTVPETVSVAQEGSPVTLRWWCQQLLDIIENYDIKHDACEEEIALINDIRAAVDPAAVLSATATNP